MYETYKLIQFNPDGKIRYLHIPSQKPVRGVTSALNVIAKPQLVPWAAKMASDYWINYLTEARETGEQFPTADLELVHKAAKNAHRAIAFEAANIGKEVHAYAEAVLTNREIPKLSTPAALNGATAFRDWYKEHSFEVVASERMVFSERHFYAGTLDAIGVLNGRLSLIDFKTGSGIYPEAYLQTILYQQAYEEETGQKIEERWIIRFDKVSGKFNAVLAMEHDRDLKGALAALELHHTLGLIEKDNW